MKDYQILSYTRWDCKYHVVFIPKKRKKKIFGGTVALTGGQRLLDSGDVSELPNDATSQDSTGWTLCSALPGESPPFGGIR